MFCYDTGLLPITESCHVVFIYHSVFIKVKQKSWFGGNAPKIINTNLQFATKIKNNTLVVFSECVLKLGDSGQISILQSADMLTSAINDCLVVV